MNRVILIGNLAADPETRTTASGIEQCTFRVAIQRRYAAQNGEKLADFISIVCWRKLAENCSKYLHKGQKVAIEGSVQTRSYDAQDGSKRYVVEVVADNVEFLGSGDKTAQGGSQGSARPHEAHADAQTHQMGFTEVEDDDLPF